MRTSPSAPAGDVHTDVCHFCHGVRALSSYVALLFFGVSTLDASCLRAGGVSLGVTNTSQDHFKNPSWAVSGTVECFGDHLLQPRGVFGVSSLRGNSTIQGADATYAYATGRIAFGRIVYGTVNAGLYYTHLEAPIVPKGARDFEFGYNGGIRVILPMGHNAGIPFDLLYHRVNGSGPDSFWTFTVGLFGW